MFAFLFALVSAIAIPPKPAKYVTDNAHVLDAARAGALNEKLAQFERDTSNQILVYIDRRLPPGVTIEQMGSEAMHQWGVGQKEKNNGAVLFLFIDDRKMRIEVGYGLEAVLTDAKSREITSTILKPRLKAGDYDGAAEQGAEAMLAVARGEDLKGSGKTAHETRRPNAGPVQVQGRQPTQLGIGGCVAVAMLLFGLPIAIAILVLRKRGPRGAASGDSGIPYVPPVSDSSSSSSWSFSSSDSSSSSSSDSSSSFDGGGGDAGGGGASDSW
jgi:uncharacterized protein